jgi:hypothetical protein
VGKVGGQLGQGDRAPDLTVPVVGFRGWYADYERGLLRSTLAPVYWDQPWGRAKCLRFRGGGPSRWQRLRHPHFPPGHRCSCGYYAYYGRRCSATINGAVVLTGRIEVHREGMRAEHVRVVALAEPYTEAAHELVAAYALEWHIPLVPHNQLEQVALEWGEQMPESLRPQ